MKNHWDQQLIVDFFIGDSVPPELPSRQTIPNQYFAMHVDLDIAAAADVISLRSAMANDAAFATVVPNFLDAWRQPGDPAKSLQGLGFIATNIRSGVIASTGIWRFNVVPIVDALNPPALEFRLIVDLLSVLDKNPDKSAIIAGLQSHDLGMFRPAIQGLKQALLAPARADQYPGAGAFLGSVFG